mgnify:CR=1 FL=1|tara:strand:- start:433 stop:636 length:204 start_codon:yes stop_codon:yes gene_type:complete
MKNNKLTTVVFATLPMYACIDTGKETDTSLSEDTSCSEEEVVLIPNETGEDTAEETEDTGTETSGSR